MGLGVGLQPRYIGPYSQGRARCRAKALVGPGVRLGQRQGQV